MKYNFYLEKDPKDQAIYLREDNIGYKTSIKYDTEINNCMKAQMKLMHWIPRLDINARGKDLDKSYKKVKAELDRYDSEAELRKYLTETSTKLSMEFNMLDNEVESLPKDIADGILENRFYSKENDADVIKVKAVSKIIKDYLDTRFKAEQ